MDMKGHDNLLRISWHDSAWLPILNPGNVLDYFSERSNPFYDRTCNNEIVKMQRLNVEQLSNMTGLEYILLHAQEPILYVIRKQHRHSPTQTTPIAEYYILAGVVYQAPDLGSVVNSRLLNTAHHLQSAFDECQSYSRYHPSKGYSWEFKDKQEEKSDKKDKKKDEPGSAFQRHRMDMLLVELSKKFPPKQLQIEGPPTSSSNNAGPGQQNKDAQQPQSQINGESRKGQGEGSTGQQQDVKPDVSQLQAKLEKDQATSPSMKPPPEKRPKTS